MNDKIIGEIFSTMDYDKFKRLDGNRDVKNAKKIVNSINDVGYILSPILVNEFFEVIDGQNRLDALKELGLPVLYIVQPGIGIKECMALNINQTNWNTEQFIISFATRGDESYIRLYDLVKTFKKKGFGIEGVLFMADPSFIPMSGGTSYDVVKRGKFRLSEGRYELTQARLQSAIDLGFAKFKETYSMAGRSYWGAIAYAYEHQEVEVKQLARKMFEAPLEIVPVSTVVSQLRYLDEAYNKGKRAENKVFMSTDFQKRRFIGK